MGTITFIHPDGARTTVAIRPGNTVMEAAVACDLQGIEAQCYGAGICGTCHVLVDGSAAEALEPAGKWELEMLGCLELAGPASRLACQLRFTPALEGAEFTLPERQDAIA